MADKERDIDSSESLIHANNLKQQEISTPKAAHRARGIHPSLSRVHNPAVHSHEQSRDSLNYAAQLERNEPLKCTYILPHHDVATYERVYNPDIYSYDQSRENFKWAQAIQNKFRGFASKKR